MTSAPVIDTLEDAKKKLADVGSVRPPTVVLVDIAVEFEVDNVDEAASIDVRVLAGRPAWLTSDTETAIVLQI